jgi:hypothetical protein
MELKRPIHFQNLLIYMRQIPSGPSDNNESRAEQMIKMLRGKSSQLLRQAEHPTPSSESQKEAKTPPQAIREE